jgi:hypothetical protein
MAWPSGGPRTWVPGESLTATLLNAQLRDALNLLATYIDTTSGKPTPHIQVVRQTTIITKNNSAAYADLTGLAHAIAANETWVYLAGLWATAASATPNMKFTLTGPASPTAVLFGLLGNAIPITQGFNTTFGSDAIYTKTVLNEVLLLLAIVRNGANAGTVQLQFAQNTANASNSSIQQDSFMLAARLL